jgi:hypothetical protein
VGLQTSGNGTVGVLRLVVACFALAWALAWGSLIVYAQGPVTARAVWSPNPAGDGVTHYTLTVDGGTPITIQAVSCGPTACEFAVTVSPATHTFHLTASNPWGTSPPAVATQDLSGPTTPTNFRIER